MDTSELNDSSVPYKKKVFCFTGIICYSVNGIIYILFLIAEPKTKV